MIKNEEVRKTLDQMEFNHSKYTKREMVEKICKTISYIEDLEYKLGVPEPIKVGDWCRSDIAGWVRIFKVESIEHGMYKNNSAGLGFMKDEHCTKLTTEQIEILGLEE